MDILQEILSGFGFDWKLAFASSINFLILFLLFKKFFFGKIAQLLEERSKTIQDGVDKSIKAEEILGDAQSTYETMISDAKKEGGEIIEAYKQRAKNTHKQLLDDIHASINVYKDNLMSEAEKNQKEVYASTMDQVSKELVTHFREYFSTLMTPEINKEYIDSRKS